MIDWGRRRLTDRSYRVGGVMFATLYELLGADRFNAIVGGYYRQYATGGTTNEFVRFASANGDGDLARFFDDWIFTTRWLRTFDKANSVSDLAAPYRRPQ
jgi:hypothetical protein